MKALLNEGKAYGIIAAIFAIGTAGAGGIGAYLRTVAVLTVIGCLAWLPLIKRAQNPVIRFGIVPVLYVAINFVYAAASLSIQGVFGQEGRYEAFVQHYGLAILINYATAVLASAISPLLSPRIQLLKGKAGAPTRRG